MTVKREIALVVEDEPLIAMLACDLLSDLGYIVFEARTTKEAMEVLTDVEGILILFTDVDLADGSSGVDLAVLAKQQFPTVRIVVTSGRVKPATLPDSVPFIPKPYSRECLTTALREQLASRNGDSAEA
ncbi:response regulator [Agrobacterium rubi]|uniref:response regulator n=1 Tax=Agrobacterium rubi TaxID=28099 RepID=UPI0015723797|nr:response regulator [Agrobacterium rubi]NTF22384.1 response regulator [Agrobacterium rubi]NTF29241.1 response regulator [Agrobacterium rubi]